MGILRYVLILFFALEALVINQAKASDHQTSFCQNSDLNIHTSQSPEATGMSHSGVNIYLHNLSEKICILKASPKIFFLGKNNSALDIHAISLENNSKKKTNLVLSASGSDTAIIRLRWISNEVFDHNICFTPAKITYHDKHLTLHTSVQAHICGEVGKPITFEQMPIQIKKLTAVQN